MHFSYHGADDIRVTRLTGQRARLVRDRDSTGALSPLAGKRGQELR